MQLSDAGMHLIRIDESDEARAITRAVQVVADNNQAVTPARPPVLPFTVESAKPPLTQT